MTNFSIDRLSLAAFATIFLAVSARAENIDDLRTAISKGDLPEADLILTTLSPASEYGASLALLAATLRYRQGRTGEAQAMLLDLHARYPTMPEPLNNLAAIAADSGRLDEARELLERALSTHPGYASAYENLGNVYSELASEAYAKALAGRTDDSATRAEIRLIDRIVVAGNCDATPAGGNP